jgi:hypothetical protein
MSTEVDFRRWSKPAQIVLTRSDVSRSPEGCLAEVVLTRYS